MTAEPLRRRAPDGTVFQRVAKHRPTAEEPLQFTTEIPGDVIVNRACFHWCNTESPELLTRDTPAHVCDIWEVSEDQTEPQIPAAEAAELTTDELIRRVLLFTEEQLSGEPAPLLTRTAVLALLQQAKQLEKIVVLLEDWRQRSRPPADSPNEQC